MGRGPVLSDEVWARIEPLLPAQYGKGRPFRHHRQVIEGIVFRYRCGIASSNFVVHNIDSGGDNNLLINEIGGYTGTVPLTAPSIVEVQSSGDWTLTPR